MSGKQRPSSTLDFLVALTACRVNSGCPGIFCNLYLKTTKPFGSSFQKSITEYNPSYNIEVVLILDWLASPLCTFKSMNDSNGALGFQVILQGKIAMLKPLI
jgi:hypothetical protein